MGIITAAGNNPPEIAAEKASFCISCGHCEAFCSSGALVLDYPGSHEVQESWKGEGITPALIGKFLKTRRSIRQYKQEPVSRETITAILDIVRYAASAGNGQPVEWLVFHDPREVHEVARLSIDWMRTLAGSDHPMSPYIPSLLDAWDAGIDVICRGAPHLVVPHVPDVDPMAQVDGIIALTHVDIAAPAFGVGACWAGFVSMAIRSHAPLVDYVHLPKGRIPAYALMLGYPVYTPSFLPQRKPLSVTWH
jgi:nitroreductase